MSAGSSVIKHFLESVKGILEKEGKSSPELVTLLKGLEETTMEKVDEEIEEKTTDMKQDLETKAWGDLIMDDEVCELLKVISDEYNRLKQTSNTDRVIKWGHILGSRKSTAAEAGPLTSLERSGLDIAV